MLFNICGVLIIFYSAALPTATATYHDYADGDCVSAESMNKSCASTYQCCEWHHTEVKVAYTCDRWKKCTCIAPGQHCSTGYRCCDGAMCSGLKCPPAAEFFYCETIFKKNCQPGLTCTTDDQDPSPFAIMQEFFGYNNFTAKYRGRCLKTPTISAL